MDLRGQRDLPAGFTADAGYEGVEPEIESFLRLMMRREIIPYKIVSQSVIPRYARVIRPAAASGMRKEARARVIAPSTNPIPEGVGETIKNR